MVNVSRKKESVLRRLNSFSLLKFFLLLPICFRSVLGGLTRREKILILTGAEEVNRTPDLLITNQLLYHLSYFGPNMFFKAFILCMQVIFNKKNEPR